MLVERTKVLALEWDGNKNFCERKIDKAKNVILNTLNPHLSVPEGIVLKSTFVLK